MGLGQIIGDILGVGGDSGAGNVYQDYANLFKNISLPELEKIQYQDYLSAGQYDPEVVQTLLQGNSNLSDISLDPRLREAQISALSNLQNIAENGGLTFGDKARLAEIQASSLDAERGQREAILQNARARGIGGSGIELASQLINQQGSAGRRNLEGLNVAADAEKRALEAMLQSGNLGGQIRSQDYSEKARAAEAQDAINRFNIQNSQDQLINAANARNQAQQFNLTNAQNIMNQNTQNRNNAINYNAQLAQQNFENQLKKAGAQGAGYQGIAQTLEDQKKRQDSFTGSLLGLGGAVASGYLAGR
jgi:hypothetical protein